MSDLELLTSKLNEFGYGYRIESPRNLDTEANMVVIAKSSKSLCTISTIDFEPVSLIKYLSFLK